MKNPYLYLLINHHFLVLISLQVCTLADFLYGSIYSLQSWVQKASVGDKTMNQSPLVRLFLPTQSFWFPSVANLHNKRTAVN